MREDKYALGLVSISFRKHSPVEILEAASSAELSLIEWGSDVHAPCRDTEGLTQLARLQSEYGIRCSSYGTYFRLGETPIEELPEYIAAAKLLGTDILRLWCGTRCGAEYTDEERQSLIAQCREAALIAIRENVTLCMECHKKTFTERLSDAIALMEEIDSPNFRMYWQPFQWQSVNENLAYARAIAPYTRHIHVFQWKNKEKFSLNDGIEEWREYLRLLPAPRALLLEFMPDDDLNSLSIEAKALKNIIGALQEE